ENYFSREGGSHRSYEQITDMGREGVYQIMKIFVIVIIFLVLAGWDVPDLLNKNRKKDLVVYSMFMITGLILSFLVVFHVPLPNPSKGLEAIFKPFGSLLKAG
ncbi:MAG: hypothetical protein K0Q73_5921, partial [Paenibacillus sp.]|nr:hypothetical protein [Paenibacillus sp.]